MIPISSNIYRKTGLILIFIFIFILINNLSSFATEGQLAEIQEEGLWADSITTSFVEGSADEIIAEGKALMFYEDYRIEADYIEYNLLTDDIYVEGNIIFNNEDYQLYTDKMAGNLKKSLFEAVGNVLLKGSELELSSTELLIQEDGKLMTFKGDGALTYKEIEAVADTVIYDSIKELALLEGNVVGHNREMKLAGDKLELNLKNEQMKLLGKAEFLFKDKGGE